MTTNKSLDIAVWLVVLGLLVLGIWANYYYSNVDISLRLIGWILLAAVMVGIALQSSQGHKGLEFAKEARTELRKVVWPTRQETLQTTGIVIVLVIILALIIWGIDMIFLHLVGWLAGQ